jgi:hypothetical protein
MSSDRSVIVVGAPTEAFDEVLQLRAQAMRMWLAENPHFGDASSSLIVSEFFSQAVAHKAALGALRMAQIGVQQGNGEATMVHLRIAARFTKYAAICGQIPDPKPMAI